jgi:hypothetical protein
MRPFERPVSKVEIHNSSTATLGNTAVNMHHPWGRSRSESNPSAALECHRDNRGCGKKQLLVHAIEYTLDLQSQRALTADSAHCLKTHRNIPVAQAHRAMELDERWRGSSCLQSSNSGAVKRWNAGRNHGHKRHLCRV